MKWLFIISLLFSTHLTGQGLKVGDVVSDITFAKVLNAPYTTSSLAKQYKKITILDFFGTWCVPCIKALPKLTELQRNNKDVQVLLLSIEDESRLRSFLAKQKELLFPIIVDAQEKITNTFQPPLYLIQ